MQIRNTQTLALAEVDDELGNRLIAGGFGYEDASTPIKRTRAPRKAPEPTTED